MWAFATSPYGLALTEQQWWAMTPREYIYLRERWYEARMFHLSLNAGIQATLHNAHFQTDGKPFTAEMFMPGYKHQAKQTWQEQKRMAQEIASMKRNLTPEDLRRLSEGDAIFRDRSARAKAMQAAGAPAEKIRAVMEGIQ
jgi:hypothetical protein